MLEWCGQARIFVNNMGVKVQVLEGAECNNAVYFVIRQSLKSPDALHDLHDDVANQEFFFSNMRVKVQVFEVHVFEGAENNKAVYTQYCL